MIEYLLARPIEGGQLTNEHLKQLLSVPGLSLVRVGTMSVTVLFDGTSASLKRSLAGTAWTNATLGLNRRYRLHASAFSTPAPAEPADQESIDLVLMAFAVEDGPLEIKLLAYLNAYPQNRADIISCAVWQLIDLANPMPA